MEGKRGRRQQVMTESQIASNGDTRPKVEGRIQEAKRTLSSAA